MKKIILLFLAFCFLMSMNQTKKTTEVNAINPIEQDFHHIYIEAKTGELDIYLGEELSFKNQYDEDLEYTIEEDTLYIIKKTKGSVTLTLPQDYTYEQFEINGIGGDINIDTMPVSKELNVSIEAGNVILSNCECESSTIQMENGYAFISGNLGKQINGTCHDGYMKLKVAGFKENYNYQIHLTHHGYLNIGGYKYDNVDVKEQVFNRVRQEMDLHVTGGNMIIKFLK